MTRFPASKSDREEIHRLFGVWAVLLWCSLGSSFAVAQQRVLVEGILDAEAYKTDAGSYSLSRNNGDLSTTARLQLWSAWQVSPGLQMYARGELESYDAGAERETESAIRQIALRYSGNSASFYFIEVGKLLPPIAIASARQLSTQNPLIGQPNFLYAAYPLGIQVMGSAGWFDYRAALVDLPAIDPEYLPAGPTSSFRPDLGFGVTPLTGLRFGVAYTKGPYLSRSLDGLLPPGSRWNDFDQQLRAFEFQFSRGYAELNSELVRGEYEIPLQSKPMDVTDYFLEFKYTLTPRFYGALRFERNEYPFIRHLNEIGWLAQDVTIHNLEIGFGYRFSADTQLKIAYSNDHWSVANAPDGAFPAGHSLSLQLSYHFDVVSWLATER